MRQLGVDPVIPAPRVPLGNAEAEILQGLERSPRRIAPKYFYDDTGSHLFEAICRQPEYYPPHAERAILAQHLGDFAEACGPVRVLVEPGSGNCRKVRTLLKRLRPSVYVPIDISCGHLRAAATQLAQVYPWLAVRPLCSDYCHGFDLPAHLPSGPRLGFYPGSSIGNFEPTEAVAFLRALATALGPQGMLLIGVDCKKDTVRLTAAYNDRAGVTAAFNLNLLTRLNREFGADFEPRRFRHCSFYNEAEGRIEMHLISRCRQTVTFAGRPLEFAAGESIHTENSYKYAPWEFQALARRAGYEPRALWSDPEDLFSLHFLAVGGGSHLI